MSVRGLVSELEICRFFSVRGFESIQGLYKNKPYRHNKADLHREPHRLRRTVVETE